MYYYCLCVDVILSHIRSMAHFDNCAIAWYSPDAS